MWKHNSSSALCEHMYNLYHTLVKQIMISRLVAYSARCYGVCFDSVNSATNLNTVRDKLYVCLQTADDELCFHIPGPSIARVLAKLSSQSGRLKPLHRRWAKSYGCLQRADDELCFHISGPSIAQVLAKLSSQSGRLKPQALTQTVVNNLD